MSTRQTRSRRALFQLLQSLDAPARIEELHARLPAQEHMALSTVYRNINKWTQEGLLLRTTFGDGSFGYRMATTPLLSCKDCHQTVPVSPSLYQQLHTAILNNTQYQLAATPTLDGLCPACAQKEPVDNPNADKLPPPGHKKIQLFLVSGFLGAGKTTLIQQLMPIWALENRMAVIENEFGEVGIDSSRLNGTQVLELSAGCICCTLTTDFTRTLTQAAQQLQPDLVVIEPSGVSRLSDILALITQPPLSQLYEYCGAITLIDALRFELYRRNLPEFYMDQIQHASALVLTRTDTGPQETTEKALATLTELFPHTPTLSARPSPVMASQLLGLLKAVHLEQGVSCPAAAHSACDAHPCPTAPAFESRVLTLQETFPSDRLYAWLWDTCRKPGILRIKGHVHTTKGWQAINAVPAEVELVPCGAMDTGQIVVIGTKDSLSGEGLFDELEKARTEPS